MVLPWPVKGADLDARTVLDRARMSHRGPAFVASKLALIEGAASPRRVNLLVSSSAHIAFVATLIDGASARSWMSRLEGHIDTAILETAPKDTDPADSKLAALALLMRGHGLTVSDKAWSRIVAWIRRMSPRATSEEWWQVGYAAGVFDTKVAEIYAGYPETRAPFVPGKTFGPDPQGRLAYLLAAKAHGAQERDLTPAIYELVRLFPALEGARVLNWTALVFATWIWLVDIGKIPPQEFSATLHEILQGWATEEAARESEGERAPV
jgi:hypothetical protein